MRRSAYAFQGAGDSADFVRRQFPAARYNAKVKIMGTGLKEIFYDCLGIHEIVFDDRSVIMGGLTAKRAIFRTVSRFDVEQRAR